MAKISPLRWSEMERFAGQNPAARFDIVITLRDSAAASALEIPGLLVKHRTFNIVSGSATLDALNLLSARHEVELVEEDGKAKAMGAAGD